MRFKTNKVWVEVDAQDRPLVKNGKARIKYQLDQPHEYWVRLENIDPLDFKKIVIYTDGASSGNPGPSGIGVFLQYGEHQKEISRYIGRATNNIAELEAIKAALLSLKTSDLPVRIHTDSNYAYGLLTLGWKPKKNIRLVAEIKSLMEKFTDLVLIKVKGHAGEAGNEKADRLATAAIELRRNKSSSDA